MATKQKTKKKATKKAPKIETIKIGIEPNNTVTYDGVRYEKQANGNYLNRKLGKEVKFVC